MVYGVPEKPEFRAIVYQPYTYALRAVKSYEIQKKGAVGVDWVPTG